MDRRSLLGELVAVGTVGVGGCTTSVSSPPTETGTSSSATPYPEGEQRRVSLDDQDTVPEEYDMEITVEVVDRVITHEQTARLRITTTNDGPERGISIQEPKCDLLDRHKAGSDPPGLWLYPPGRTPPENGMAERNGNKWVADLPPEEDRGFGDYGCGVRNYESGESLQNEYLIWDDYQTEGYLEPSTYRWEEPEIEITEPAPHDGDTETLGTFSWGFSVTIEDLDR